MKNSESTSGTGGGVSPGEASLAYVVTDFGARGDGRTDNRDALQRAIDVCAAAGGGTVLVPAGDFVTGTIYLRSHVELKIGSGGQLRGTQNNAHYDVSVPNPETILPVPPDHWHGALIVARGVEAVTISGPGTIRGRGYGLGRAGVPTDFRPRLLSIEDSRDVVIDGVRLRDQDRWCLHLFRCDRVQVRHVSIVSHPEVLTTDDGIDIDGCHDVVVSGCHISTGDDAICVKSSDYLGEARTAENILITDCTIRSVTCAFKIGAMESIKDISGVTVSNLAIVGGSAIHIYARSGGHYSRINLRGLNMRATIDPGDLGRAIRPLECLDLVSIKRIGTDSGEISGITLSDSTIWLDFPSRILVRGASAAEPVTDISIGDVAITTGTGVADPTVEAAHVAGLITNRLTTAGRSLEVTDDHGGRQL